MIRRQLSNYALSCIHLITYDFKFILMLAADINQNTGPWSSVPSFTNPACVLTRQPKPFMVGFLYSPPDKADFFSCINHFYSQFNTLDTQECYVLMGFNINLLFKCNEIFSNEIAETASEEMPFHFFYSLGQITTTPTGTTDRTATLSHKVSQFRLFFRSLAHTLHTKGITTKVA